MLTLAIALAVSFATPTVEAPETTEPQTVTISQTADDGDAERETAARAWLTLVDRSDWEASYAAAGKAFQAPNTVATWQGASEAVRVPLGAVIEREAVEFQYVNAPPNGYEVVRFRSKFAKRDAVIETVTLEREPDGLKVVGYFIN
jgi:hypothetical protein